MHLIFGGGAYFQAGVFFLGGRGRGGGPLIGILQYNKTSHISPWNVKVSCFTDSVTTSFKVDLPWIFCISLNSQKICLCHRKPENDGPVVVTIAIFSVLQLLTIVFGCRQFS